MRDRALVKVFCDEFKQLRVDSQMKATEEGVIESRIIQQSGEWLCSLRMQRT